jgi:hypothetical protein
VHTDADKMKHVRDCTHIEAESMGWCVWVCGVGVNVNVRTCVCECVCVWGGGGGHNGSDDGGGNERIDGKDEEEYQRIDKSASHVSCRLNELKEAGEQGEP